MMNKKEALDMTIKQWQIMADIPEVTKEQAYESLKGLNYSPACFLCDNLECIDCIDWCKDNTLNEYHCTHENSPFQKWCSDRSEENTLLMLNHLKAEREKLA